MGNRRSCYLAHVLLIMGGVSANAAPVRVTGVTTVQVGNDLQISWTLDPSVNGYRVYRATDAACASHNLVATLPPTQTSWTASGALGDIAPGLYHVLAFDATGESIRSETIYEYPAEIVYTPAAMNVNFVTFPPQPWYRARDLCTYLNAPGPLADSVVSGVKLYAWSTDSFWSQSCAAPSNGLALIDAEATALQPNGATQQIAVYGVGSVTAMSIPGPYRVDMPGGAERNLFPLALPYDHDYVDLLAVAADIPSAVIVKLWDHAWTWDGTGSKPAWGIGLTRDTPTSPWTGPNLSLASHRGEGLLIGVAQPATWLPRTNCQSSTPMGPTAAAGGPYSMICNGGITGIWLDGSTSFTNGGSVSYSWTTTCAGTILNPTDVVSMVAFDCRPCQTTDCDVTLTIVEDGLSSSDTVTVTTRASSACIEVGNQLRAVRAGDEVQMSWFGAPASNSFVALTSFEADLRFARRNYCGPDLWFQNANAADPIDVQYYVVDGFSEMCAFGP